MISRRDDALKMIAQSNRLRRVLGKCAIDEDMGERFLANPLSTLKDIEATLEPHEIEVLSLVLRTIGDMSSSERQRIRGLTDGADKVIR
jgi:hypothetical protein